MPSRCRTRRLPILAAALVGLVCGAPADTRPRNLLLVTVDTLRADRLGAYGYAQARTPVIDALAARGTLFERASTCIPRTTQALASLFTSRHAREHGVLEIGERLPARAFTLAERLAAAGFATAGISANGAASRLQGLAQGFETFVDVRDLARDAAAPPPLGGVVGATAVSDAAITWLGQRGSDARPYFLWLLYMDPHFRYEPPPRWNGGRDGRRAAFYAALERFEPRHPSIYFDLTGASSRAQPELSRLYDGEIAYVDAELGRVLAELARRGERDDTLVVFTADHGESLGEHGYFYEHGDFVYEPSTHIPLLFEHPGSVRAGARSELPVSILDVAPTALALLGLSGGGSDASGVNLSAVLSRNAPDGPGMLADRVVIAESGSALWPQNARRALGGRRTAKRNRRLPFRYAREDPWVIVERAEDPGPALYDVRSDPALVRDVSARWPEVTADLSARLATITPLAGRWHMARDARFKLVRMPELAAVRYALFDLAADPGELRDVGPEHPQVAARLRAALDDFLRAHPEVPTSPVSERSPGEEREVEERLRALGYVE